MEREKIIKALEICSNYKGCSDCKDCPLHNDEYVQCEQNVLEGLALSLIKELTEDNDKLLTQRRVLVTNWRDTKEKVKELTQAHEMLSESYDHLEKTKDELLAERSRLTEEIETLKKAKYIYATVDYCADDLAEALEENKRLTEENKKLTSIGISKDIIIEGINDVIVKLNEGNERLNTSCTELTQCCTKLETLYKIECKRVDIVKADTVKKMQERLNSVRGYDDEFEYNSWWGERINQIAKEMLEERE